MYFTLIKFIAPVVVFGALWWRYDYVTTQNERLQSDLSAANEQLAQSQAIIAKERQNAAEAALRAQKHFEQKVKDDEELQKLRACYADRSCWPRVRIKTTCPKLPSAATNAGALEESTAELGENAGHDLLLLRDQIKETNRLVAGLQSELMARSVPDYCQPK